MSKHAKQLAGYMAAWLGSLFPVTLILSNHQWELKNQCQVIEDTLYVFHGRRRREEYPHISALDLTSWNWTNLMPEGIPPPYPLIYFSSWAYKNRMYIFGGQVLYKDSDDQWTNDFLSNELFYYDISSNRWEWPSMSGIFKPFPFNMTFKF